MVITVLWVQDGRGYGLGLLRLRLWLGQALVPAGDAGRRPHGPSFSEPGWDLVCVHCAMGETGQGSSGGLALVPQEDPRDPSM